MMAVGFGIGRIGSPLSLIAATTERRNEYGQVLFRFIGGDKA